MNYYYSIDGGKSWEGPFSQSEIDNLKAVGIIDAQTLIRQDGVAQQPMPQPVGYSRQPVTPQMPPAEEQYMLLINGIPAGPYPVSTITLMLQNKEIRVSDMAWKEGMTQWMPLSSILSTDQLGNSLPSLRDFSLGKFFSQVFTHHTKEEMMDCFIAGTRQGTPPLSAVQTSFPTPWIFARMLAFCLILFFGFGWALDHFGNMKLVPGLLFVGNFAIPFCCFFLFYELNVRRDVLLYDGLKAFVGGGLISLIVALLLFSSSKTTAPIWAGPVEEPAKVLAAVLIAGSMRNGRILNGLLFGAAVGAGFAAFESAGYTFEALFAWICGHWSAGVAEQMGNVEAATQIMRGVQQYNPDEVMHLRALLTPFAHVVWTAIAAAAYWMVLNEKIREKTRRKEDCSIDFSVFTDIRFLRIFAIPVVLHMIWNSSLFAEYFIIRYVSLGIIGWIIALRLVKLGLNQIAYEKLNN